MKVLLIGNYANARQESMQRFAEMMRRGLVATGFDVQLLRPPVVLGRMCRGEEGLAKWFGYIDRFILFPALLRWRVRWADIVHICDHANAVYIPHLCRKRHILTCHDLLAIRAARGEISESPTRWSGKIFQRWILRNMRRAQVVACVSEHTRAEVLRIVGLPYDRVIVVSNALNYPYRRMARDEALVRLKHLGVDPKAPYLLHVGGNDWYKNKLGMIRIFNSLVCRPRFRNFHLVTVGKPWNLATRSLVTDLSLSAQVHELINVSNEELRALYSSAQALLFPSLEEGFGWPVVEAQACGCLVITTQRSPMTEVSGGAAIFVDPAEIESAAFQIESAWERRSQLVNDGLANAKHYDLQMMIDGYAAAYLLARGQPPVGRSV